MIDFFTFALQNVTATTARKTELKNAFAKQIGWTAKITDNKGKEIDNPVSFQDAFNKSFCQYLKQTCVAGQQKLDKESAKTEDTFEDLIK